MGEEIPQQRNLVPAIEEFLARQRPNWPGWLAVFLGAGIALYFALPIEPPNWAGAVGIALCGLGLYLTRRFDFSRLALAGLLAAAIGFGAAQIRANLVAAPQLERAIHRALIEGRVTEVELFPGAERVTLDLVSIAGLDAADTPQTIRVKLNKPGGPIAIGQRLRITADLQPPAPPVAPGAFDFRRQAYFDRLGAVGFSLQAPIPLAANADGLDPLSTGIAPWFESLRLTIAARVRALLPGAEGGMAMALLVGNQTALGKQDIQAMRDSGLAHLLSISGLHIGLAAGLFFVGLRALLALVPAIALGIDTKKLAAFMAMCGAAFYAGLAGMPVPTERALFMTGIVFLAVILDRSPISFRLIAWAAILVLLAAPESLTGASFQMSFAAVLGLIATFDAGRRRFAAWRRAGRGAPDLAGRIIGLAERGVLWLAMLMLSSLVAGLMTAPFAAYHFDRLSLYGLVANMLAVPLTGFWIMPWAVVALIAMPFGLDALPLALMGLGCRFILDIAHWVADWPLASLLVPAMPMAGLLLMSAGLVWLCLIIGRWRWIGLAPILLGILSPLTPTAPDILVSGDGKLVAVRNEDGLYRFSAQRASRIAGDTWLRRNAQEKRLPFPKPSEASAKDFCNPDWCRFDSRVGPVAVVLTEAGIAPACAATRLVVSLEPVRGYCPAPDRVIDRFDLWRQGAHAIWLRKDGSIEIASVLENVGDRPWALKRKRKKKEAPPQVEAPLPKTGGDETPPEGSNQ